MCPRVALAVRAALVGALALACSSPPPLPVVAADSLGAAVDATADATGDVTPDTAPDACPAASPTCSPQPKLQAPAKIPLPYVAPGKSLTQPVQLGNLGDAPLLVYRVDRFGDPAFTLHHATADGPTGKPWGDKLIFDPPLAIAPGGKASFGLELAVQDDKPKVASLLIQSNDPVWPKGFAVALAAGDGGGVVPACPVAKIEVKEGDEVIPQTLLHLSGVKSSDANGKAVAKYKWTVKQPSGSTQAFVPTATHPVVVFQANVAGEYVFCLDVWNDQGVQSCQPACKSVLFIAPTGLHVELLWDTPGDKDQTDSGPGAGADLNLHVAHPMAAGPDLDCDGKGDPWFSNPFDCFWFNPSPNWGSADPAVADDPSLDMDDTDGAGPENFNLDLPEGDATSPASYPVGVHYWHDHGFGTSLATVNVYVLGTLEAQFAKVPMKTQDMWYVGKFHWPNAKSGGTGPVFTQCFQGGDVCGGMGKPWQASGKPCITHCYENKSFSATAGAPGPCPP